MSKIYNLTIAKHLEFADYLVDELELTKEQAYHLRYDGVIKYSDYYIFKEKPKAKENILLRLTILVFPIWFLILFISLPFNWIIKKQWGYSARIGEILIGKWANKLQINY